VKEGLRKKEPGLVGLVKDEKPLSPAPNKTTVATTILREQKTLGRLFIGKGETAKGKKRHLI